MLPTISIIINCDTREEKKEQSGLFSGTVNKDFLTDGIYNKQKFFSGFDIETIVFIDKHQEIPEKALNYLYRYCDTVVIRKHTNENSFNDYNYLNALSLARGKYVCHCDQDTACFTSSKEPIEQMIKWLEEYRFVSYPSRWSPRAIDDNSFGQRTWASTRFFMCKRESLKLDELKRCIEEPNYGYEKYGDSPRRCNWLEHFLTLTNNDSCYYPPINLDTHAIFSWSKYEELTLMRLNELPYPDVKRFIDERGGINYPCDVAA